MAHTPPQDKHHSLQMPRGAWLLPALPVPAVPVGQVAQVAAPVALYPATPFKGQYNADAKANGRHDGWMNFRPQKIRPQKTEQPEGA